MGIEELTNCDLKLPNYTKEIKKINNLIYILKTKIKKNKFEKNLDIINYKKLYNEIIQILDYLGKLSTPAFNIEKELEDIYLTKYIKTPELGRKLWWNHYEKLHEPYSKLKNTCFKLISTINKEYKIQHNVHPPSWDNHYQ